jgi:hypothetical protein
MTDSSLQWLLEISEMCRCGTFMSRTNAFGFESFARDVTAMLETCLKPYAVSLVVALPANDGDKLCDPKFAFDPATCKRIKAILCL